MIGKFGAPLLRNAKQIMTHCNAGALATAGYGTALGVIRALKESGKQFEVYVNETRPFLQGARLTAWELKKEKIPATLVTDNMVGYLMQQGRVDAVVVGCDRVAANGDVANKIGTYTVAVLAKRHGIPFYVAGPTSSIDIDCPSGQGYSDRTARRQRGVAYFRQSAGAQGHEGVQSGIRRDRTGAGHGYHYRKGSDKSSVPAEHSQPCQSLKKTKNSKRTFKPPANRATSGASAPNTKRSASTETPGRRFRTSVRAASIVSCGS